MMKVTRKFTTAGHDPFATVEWTTRSSKISNPDGSVVFEMPDAEVPVTWSQLATDIMVSKYFRKAGVPQFEQVYSLPSTAGAVMRRDDSGKVVTGPERSARQVIHRLAGCWRFWGETHGYFDTSEDAEAFYDELVYMMVHQMCAPNSPQWFNTGLHWAYGITGPAQGHFVPDPKTGEVFLAPDAYSHPQPHACFIQSIADDLVSPGGIMDLWVREARLFKYGSGTGTNFSRLRGEGERLSGGGKSSGLMSWLRIGDRAAAAIKSGGTTRRAAKMVCLDMDHPDIEEFVNWKVREEVKVAALVEGLKVLKAQDESIAQTAERLGMKLDYDFNGEAYLTVSGQNSNNSLRIPDAFFDAVDADGEWRTTWRTTGEVARTFKARKLWDQIGYAAWRCADPGVQYDDTINAWHTCPNGGRINASNPCSEYMFLDNTACNLASLNVLKFYDSKSRVFDVAAFEHGIDLWTTVLEISVLMAAYPSEEIATLSYRYRTLGLGYANLGAMVMQAGIPYDSDESRAVCACVSAVLTGRSYRQSALLAGEHGPFAGFEADRDGMLRVIRNHRRAAHGVARDAKEWEGLRVRPVPIDHELCSGDAPKVANIGLLAEHAMRAWDDALAFGDRHGYRNAQVTVIAPTGTIGLLMDCDTTGVEPDFALVKFKKLAGGGYFKIVNESVKPALESLGYSDGQIREMLDYVLGTLHLETPMPKGVKGAQPGQTFAQWLRGKGLTEDDLGRITRSLRSVFELGFAFTPWSLGDEAIKRLGFDPEKAKADPRFDTLRRLGLRDRHIGALNEAICGTQMIEGAPHLRDEHLPVFDCANTCGKGGKRFIAPGGHIRMMAAAQPFISGAISKTINLPNDATVEDIERCYRQSWELGLKANALYRDGCKLSQPLSNKSDTKAEVDLDEEVDEAGEAEAKAEVATAVAGLAAVVADGEAASAAQAPAVQAKAAEQAVQIVHRPMRRRLPDTRSSLTHKFNVAGHEGYLTVGLYEDGKPGELFITMAKEGSTIGGLMDSLGTATSVALQYGVPIESLVNKFTHQRFEPAGMTTNRDIPMAKSLVDYIFRWMGMEFIPGYREANAPQRPSEKKAVASADGAAKREEMNRLTGTAPEGATRHGLIETRRGNVLGGGRTVFTSSVTQTERVEQGDTAYQTSHAATLSLAMDSVNDAPPCDVCGTITVRSGTCYKCLNCGNSMGCS
jgi:ribonucleoside-diphosphate reductase alpha chain